jgi:hypothetical protein
MIEQIKKFRCSDGEEFDLERDAQQHERIVALILLFTDIMEEPDFPYLRHGSSDVAHALAAEITKDKYLDRIFGLLQSVKEVRRLTV